MADLIFIGIIIVSAIIGRHSGFLKGMVNFVCIVIASFGGYLLYPFLSAFLVETPLFQTISKPINEYITKNYFKGNSIEALNEALIKYNVTAVEDLFNKMSEGVTQVIINVLSLILIFVLLRFALKLFKGLASLITKIPVIKGLDKTLGMLTSMISAVLVVFLVVAVMMIPPCNSSEVSKKMCEYIDKSVITKQVMDYNVFISYKSLNENVTARDKK